MLIDGHLRRLNLNQLIKYSLNLIKIEFLAKDDPICDLRVPGCWIHVKTVNQVWQRESMD